MTCEEGEVLSCELLILTLSQDEVLRYWAEAQSVRAFLWVSAWFGFGLKYVLIKKEIEFRNLKSCTQEKISHSSILILPLLPMVLQPCRSQVRLVPVHGLTTGCTVLSDQDGTEKFWFSIASHRPCWYYHLHTYTHTPAPVCFLTYIIHSGFI